MNKSALTVLCISSVFIQHGYAGGINIGRTRIIYSADKKEVALPIKNNQLDLPWLIQSWTDTGDGKTRGPFIITPPLFRLDPQKEQSLRITWNGTPLPEDKESLFYMNVRTIPGTDKDSNQTNVLRLTYKTRLKLFWRPHGLDGSSDEACKNLRFSRSGTSLSVSNESAYHTVLDNLSVGTTRIKEAEIIAPQSTATFTLPGKTSDHIVTWRCITDYGSTSNKFTATLPMR